jgi:hypothetical protein
MLCLSSFYDGKQHITIDFKRNGAIPKINAEGSLIEG